ncbi:HAD-IIIA family hydrolase [Microcoleus sp. herbarium5]|uniref:HAD-IIIA family hydrolase n=1 Tax=Microcoleus sp. herbarium5 TaxID=3055434 RepID=UPI002FD25BA9
MTKIIFFDLDGTLRETASGKTFINEPTDQKAIQGTQKALAYYQEKGFICIGITNQGGVAAGHKSLQDAIEEQRITLELFPELLVIYMCADKGDTIQVVGRENITNHNFKRSDFYESFRKPGKGMIQYAFADLYNSEISSDSWMIGDRPEDEACAAAAGVKFIWASVMHAKFAGPGMREIDCQHIDPDVLMQFLAL